jgi:hypothetical protein
MPYTPKFSSLNGNLPTVYDPQWPVYTDLSPAQIDAFQSFPEDLSKYATQRRWMAELTGTSVTLSPAVTIPLDTSDRSKILIMGIRQALDDGLLTQAQFKDVSGTVRMLDATGIKAVQGAVLGFVNALFVAEATLLAGITATPPTITSRSQIDAAYAKIAPKSPSALGQG